MFKYDENDEGEIVSIKLSDSMGNRCSRADWDKYGVPLIKLFPAIQAAYADPEIVLKAKEFIEVIREKEGE